MTIRSVGYDGPIGEQDWARWLAPYTGSGYTVFGPGDFACAPAASLSTHIAPGGAHGDGVTDVSDAQVTIQHEPVTSGTRYDAIVLTRDWQGGPSTTPFGAVTYGKSSIDVVRGGTAMALPTLERSPGVGKAQHPIALMGVTAGVSTPTLAVDFRATLSKAAWVRSLLAMTGPPGTRYALAPDGRRYVMAIDSSGTVRPVPEWEPPPPVLPVAPLIGSGTAAISTNQYGSASIAHGLAWTPKVVHLSPRLATTSGMVECYVSTVANAVNSKAINLTAKIVTPDGWKSYEGNLSQVDWIAYG